ncbi:unnamed protein product [Auanema sp. JU1783]|nr:unnamed protein product [Auanema sp. JU1783]
MSSVKIFELLEVLDSLKHLKRTGWVKMGVPEPETVACHMYRMAVLAMSLEKQIDIDIYRTVRMCLVHDIAEALVGDITPYCGVSEEDKHSMEHEGIKKIASFVPAIGEDWMTLWMEYEKQETFTAKVVKHLDKFDMTSQAHTYEKKYGIDLSQFFETTKNVFTIEPFVQWDKEMRELRDKKL